MNQGVVLVEHLSTIEEVATLEKIYYQTKPLKIPYDLTPMTISVDPTTTLTITMPTPFPYENTKAIPWIYDSTVYIHGCKIEDEPLESKEPTINIVGTWGVTRSGRVFAPVPPINENGGASNQGKGKQVKSNEQGRDSTQRATLVSEVE